MFSRDSLYNKHVSIQQPSLMSFTALCVMETGESLFAGTINPGCSKIPLSGERGAWMQKPRKRPIWLGHCLLSRLELNHGTFQLPRALQMKEPSKHDNKGKLGRWLPREGRTGASRACSNSQEQRLTLAKAIQASPLAFLFQFLALSLCAPFQPHLAGPMLLCPIPLKFRSQSP